MSLLRVTQFLTADGKVQIDVTNISGRPQLPPTQEPPEQPQQRPSSKPGDSSFRVPDRDEPCSLIVSLRSSQPHLFYYRGQSSKQLLPSASAASPLPAPPPGNTASAGGGGSRGNKSNHQRGLSSLWGLEVIDPVIADVSRQSWRDCGFAPVKESASSALDKGTGGGVGDDRPLLVREELADCVLLPGERRTFLLEVDAPSVLKQFMGPPAQKNAQMASAASSRRGSAAAQDQWLSLPGRGPTTPSSNDSKTTSSYQQPATAQTSVSGDDAHPSFGARARVGTAVFQPDWCESVLTDKPASPLPQAVSKDAETSRDDRGEKAVSAERSTVMRATRQRTLPGNPGDEGGMSDVEDSDVHSLTRQPLSIVRESTTTHGSLDATRLTATSVPSALDLAPSGSAAFNSRLSSRDFAMSTAIDSATASAPLSRRASREGLRKLNTRGYVGGLPPVSASQRPTFFLYYAPLGDENKCVDQARKWLLKEQHAYCLWIERLVRFVVDLERRRERGWLQTLDHSVQSPSRPLGARRVLPPTLGELVRWRADGGGRSAVMDAMTPSPITAAALQYYYGDISPQNVARPALLQRGIGGSGTNNSDNTGDRSEKSAVELPPPFASTRRNQVSKKARKMFKEARHGAGTVVLPLRAQPHSAVQPPAKPIAGDVRWANASAAVQPLPSPGSSEMRGVSSRVSEPPYGSGAANVPSPRQQPGVQRSYNAIISPQECTMENSSELGEYRGSITPTSEARRAEAGHERPYLKSGCGLALLEDPTTGPSTSSRNSIGDGVTVMVPFTSEYLGPMADLKQSFLASGSSKVGRTETLDPASAEMAATGLLGSRWSSFNGMYYQMQRGRSDSPLQSRPRLPSFPSNGDIASPDSNNQSSASAVASGIASASRGAAQLSVSNTSQLSSAARGNAPSTNTPTRASEVETPGGRPGETSSNSGQTVLPQDGPSGAVEDGPSSSNAPSGSFVSQFIQSFYGSGGNVKSDVDNEGNTSFYRRDISSAPPQMLVYRPRNGPSGGTSSFTVSNSSGTSGNSPNRRRERLIRIAEQSMVAGGQAKVVVQQAAVTAANLLQQHGPPAMSGLMGLMSLLKDTVFTPENVNVMQMVVTPMVMACSVIVMAYLLILGGEGYGDSDVFSLMGGESL
ncbi:hypothetical protein LSCM1_06896 [Leishmania martiniquensis]|uniref:Uncharacterized protein n=1 Tax=Leishmania martiniquensis TaxID=1580590 RepID=A0A836GZ67_9TRYP|nr:hypothetical protein LSCM1_06896 [Leishmania martiniquensis]